MKDKQIPMEKVLKMFYLAGFIVFLIVGVANIITNATLWEKMLLSAKVSSVATNVFNFVVSFLFFSFAFNELKKSKIEVKGEDFEKAIEESFNK